MDLLNAKLRPSKQHFSHVKNSKLSVEDLLLNIRTQPIGPHLPSPREILHNRTEERPGKPSQPINMEDIRNYLISKKKTQKENYDKHHNTKTLPDITPGQKILFLSPAEPHQYIEGTITSHASTPRSYIIESQGRSYHCNCQHIRPLNPIITRPSPAKQPDSYTNTVITRPSPAEHQPSSHINPTNYKTITSISSRTTVRLPHKTKHFRTISHYGITSKHKTNHFKTTNIKTGTST